jgi:hypothetical protein
VRLMAVSVRKAITELLRDDVDLMDILEGDGV